VYFRRGFDPLFIALRLLSVKDIEKEDRVCLLILDREGREGKIILEVQMKEGRAEESNGM
jgi:hypothetical protein